MNISEARLKQLTTGPSRSMVGLERQRRDASERAAFRRAGMRRTQSGGNRQRFSWTHDPEERNKTAITSYPSQSSYAKDVIPEKEKERMYGKGVRSTKERALFLKRLRRQLRTTRTTRGVHNVDILPKGDFKKNDPRELMSRGRAYRDAIKQIPAEIQKAGGKRGDKITGKAAEVMIGSTNPEQGRQKRRILYSKELGATKWDPITRVQVATVKESKTFSQFINEAKEAKPPQEVLNKISSAYSKKYHGINIDASHDKSGDIRLNNLWIPPEQRNQGIGSRVLKGLSSYADRQKKRITLTQAPEKGKKAKLQNFYKSHGFKSNKGRNRDFTTRDSHIRDPK